MFNPTPRSFLVTPSYKYRKGETRGNIPRGAEITSLICTPPPNRSSQEPHRATHGIYFVSFNSPLWSASGTAGLYALPYHSSVNTASDRSYIVFKLITVGVAFAVAAAVGFDDDDDDDDDINTVETLYNTVNFCWNTHKRHSIARPKGRGMGCLLWVQRATYCVDLSKLSSIKYLL